MTTFWESLQTITIQSLIVIVPALTAMVVAWMRIKTKALRDEADRVAEYAENYGYALNLDGPAKMDVALKQANYPLSEKPVDEQKRLIEKSVKKF